MSTDIQGYYRRCGVDAIIHAGDLWWFLDGDTFEVVRTYRRVVHSITCTGLVASTALCAPRRFRGVTPIATMPPGIVETPL